MSVVTLCNKRFSRNLFLKAMGLSILKRFDLRFPCEQEKEYRDSLDADFFLPGSCVTVFVSLVCCWNLYHTSLALASSDYKTISAVMKAINIAVIGMSVAAFVLGILKQKTNHFASINSERVSLVYGSMVLLSEAIGNSWHLPLFFGERPELVFEGWNVKAQEGTLLLSIATWSCGICLATPVRAHLSWIVAFVGLSALTFISVFAGSPHPEYLPSNASRLVLLMCLCLRATYVSERNSRDEWIAQRTVKHQQVVIDQRDQAMSRILNTFCDCLLQIDSDHTILEPCQRLAAILFCQTRCDLQGSVFSEYLASDNDRANFSKAIRTCNSLMDMTPMISVRLRDKTGVVFRASLYYTCFYDKEGKLRYLIGLAESEPRSSVLPAMIPPPQNIGARTISEDSASAQSSEGSVQLDSRPLDLEECAVTFRMQMDSFQIVTCTPSFTGIIGPVEDGQCFTTFIKPSVRSSFVGWAQEFGNTILHSSTIQQLTLQSPGVKDIDYRVQTCYVDAVHLVSSDTGEKEEDDDSSVTDKDVHVRLVLKGVRMQQKTKKRRSVRITSDRDRVNL
eukprot:TRINITY_DN26988_c0_g1_i1.p1 TRINITY_DN26988_c0_g1~~TRINITY_DN26988_c0_g1_i1.p1  ORF type:complete len:564 (+),score=44.05 TRINITY_DN26988_c0_g1_i1:3-1694(+)